MQIKIIKKDIKHIYLRITENSEIILTAPYNVSDEKINNVLNKKKKWIEKHLKIIKDKPSKQFPTFKNGTKIPYLGSTLTLKLKKSNKLMAIKEKNNLIIYTDEPNNNEKTEFLIENWYKKAGFNLFSLIIDKFTPIVGKKINVLKVKKMKTRWGSCNPSKGYINLNLHLIKKPLPAIEYIILHELAHLHHQNHSKAFYNYIEKIMPDWKERNKLLKLS